LKSVAGSQPKPLLARRIDRLEGRVRPPGDKSISHRALMFGGLAIGQTRIEGLLEGEDVLRTAAALRALGAEVERTGPGAWTVTGRGVGGLVEPADVLDMGNSGTAARLMIGMVASLGQTTFFTGDASLRRRPMARVTDPLRGMGARFAAREGGRLPLAVIGAAEPLPIEYTLPVASAQVKSAILLAGLNAPGETIVMEPEATRDHSENMLRHFGAAVRVEPHGAHGRRIVLTGQPDLVARPVTVPADPSSAAFPAVAAAIRPGSDVTIENVGLNPLRAGLYLTLEEMGADIVYLNRRQAGGEPVADLHIRGARLKGVTVPAERAPSMIDEYPVLAVAAAFAEGETRMLGLAELKVKESDRLAAVAAGLAACGVSHRVEGDNLHVTGSARPAGGARIATQMDHRIAMSFLVLGLGSEEPVEIDDATMIDTSFPDFVRLMAELGAIFEPAP